MIVAQVTISTNFTLPSFDSIVMKYFVLSLIVILNTPLFGQQSGIFEQIDVFDLEYVSDPQISPDGKKIIYVRNFKDIMTDQNLSNLWIIDFDGKNHMPLTTGNQNDFHPRWSNDGKKLIYKSNLNGNVQLYMRWMDSGAIAKLTNVNEAMGSVAWSPDDQQLAFTMFVPSVQKSPVVMPSKPNGAKWNDPPVYIDQLNYRSDGRGYLKQGFRQIFILSKDGGTPRQLTFEPFNCGAPEWSNDGQSIIYSSNRRPGAEYSPLNSEVYSLSLASGDIKTLTDRFGPDANPKVSPDGKKIAYLGFDDTYQGYTVTRLYTMNSDGTGSKVLAEDLDRDIENIQWSWDSRGLYFQYDDKGDTKLAYISLKGVVSQMTNQVGGLSIGRPYSGGSFSVSANTRYAYTLAGTDHPADLAVGDGKSTRRLTDLNKDLFGHKKLGQVEEIWFKSSYDQRDIQAGL